MLDLIPLNESHTWQAMASAIATRLENFMPAQSTLVCTVTDNASNAVKLAAGLHCNLDEAQIEALPIDSWTQPVCCGASGR